MTPVIDPSWPRMGSDLENPFQNTPGQFIYALPDVRSCLSFTVDAFGLSFTSAPSTTHSPHHSSIELPSRFHQDGDEGPGTMQDEPEPKPEEDSELNANPRSDSRTSAPSPLSPTSSTSSENEPAAAKTKRSRRRRRRNGRVVEVSGCVRGPRMAHLPMPIPYWTWQRPSGVVPQSPWSYGYLAGTGGSGHLQFHDIG